MSLGTPEKTHERRYRTLGRSLVSRNNRPRASERTGSGGGIREQTDQSSSECVRASHDLQHIGLCQLVCRLPHCVQVGTDHKGQAKSGRLEQVVPTHIHERSTDEGDVRKSVQ